MTQRSSGRYASVFAIGGWMLLLGGCPSAPSTSVRVTTISVPVKPQVSSLPLASNAPTPSASPTTPSKPPERLHVLRRYHGRATVIQAALGSSPPDEEPTLEVIRDQEAYKQFVDTIPTQQVQMRQPAPRNNDPLLLRPAIDFHKHMLVVVYRPGMYFPPHILSVVANPNGTVLVTVSGRSPLPMHAVSQRVDVVSYEAVLVPKRNGMATLQVLQ